MNYAVVEASTALGSGKAATGETSPITETKENSMGDATTRTYGRTEYRVVRRKPFFFFFFFFLVPES